MPFDDVLRPIAPVLVTIHDEHTVTEFFWRATKAATSRPLKVQKQPP